MISLYDGGVYLVNGTSLIPESDPAKVEAMTGKAADKKEAKKGTIAYSILSAHNTADNMEHLKLRFDAMASHDITFVGIVQTAKDEAAQEMQRAKEALRDQVAQLAIAGAEQILKREVNADIHKDMLDQLKAKL